MHVCESASNTPSNLQREGGESQKEEAAGPPQTSTTEGVNSHFSTLAGGTNSSSDSKDRHRDRSAEGASRAGGCSKGADRGKQSLFTVFDPSKPKESLKGHAGGPETMNRWNKGGTAAAIAKVCCVCVCELFDVFYQQDSDKDEGALKAHCG